MQGKMLGRSLNTQPKRPEATRTDGHWSNAPGALATVRSLLTREVADAGNPEMSEYYGAVIEDIEREIAKNSNAVAPLPGYDAQGFLNAVATEMYVASRKGNQAGEET